MPPFGSLINTNSAPCLSAIPRTIERPMPIPSGLTLSPSVFSLAKDLSSSVGPLSETLKHQCLSSRLMIFKSTLGFGCFSTALQAFLSKLMIRSSSSSGSPTTLASGGKSDVTSTCSNFKAFSTLRALKAIAAKSELFISPFFCFAYPLTRVTMLPIRSLLCSSEPIALSVSASE